MIKEYEVRYDITLSGSIYVRAATAEMATDLAKKQLDDGARARSEHISEHPKIFETSEVDDDSK